MGHREFGTNRWRFLSKANTLYFRLCKFFCVYDVYFDCEPSIQSYASLVFLGMHASRKVQSWQKVSHLLEQEYCVVTHSIGKVSCVPENTLCELYGVKV